LSCLSLQHLNYIIGILAIVLFVFTASELHHWYLGHCLACLYGI
jgi:hypothetical protein